MYATAHIISRALDSVRREHSQVREGVACASLFRIKNCEKGGGGYLVRVGVCLFSEQPAEAVEKEKAALTVEKLFGEVLAGLCKGEVLASFRKCVRDRMCADVTCF